MILLLCGQAGAGKDTAANLLKAERYALAEPMKIFCEEIFKFSYEQLWGESKERSRPDLRWDDRSYWSDCEHRLAAIYGEAFLKRIGAMDKATPWFAQHQIDCWLADVKANAYRTRKHTARYALQTLGTDYGRKAVGPDVWVNLCLKEIHEDEPAFAVITDGRFANEVAAVQAAGGKALLIIDPAENNTDTHASENCLPPLSEFNWVIVNKKDGSPAGYDAAMKALKDNLDWCLTGKLPVAGPGVAQCG